MSRNPLEDGERSSSRPSTGRFRRPEKLTFHTVAEVAQMLGVSTRSVRRWIERGELVVHRLGGALRISDADLKAFLALHRED